MASFWFITALYLDARREVMRHMKALVFIRPTAENIMNLRKELEDPKYGEYHVY